MKSHSKLLLSCLLLPLAAAPAFSQDIDAEEEADGASRCVNIRRIDRTEVIDDQTIAFHMNNGDIYINRLERSCRNLDRGRPFSYRTSTSQLCSVDLITVQENFGGRFSPGMSCGLGVFTPADEETIAVLKGEIDEAEVTVTPIEVED